MRKIFKLLPAVAIAILIGGCSGSNATVDSDEIDISWLISGLEDAGVSIDSQGSAVLSRRSDASSRLVLNNRDIVDVYEFDESIKAYEEGQLLVSVTQRRDVYVKESLLVVHFVNPGSGVRPVLNELLGKAL